MPRKLLLKVPLDLLMRTGRLGVCAAERFSLPLLWEEGWGEGKRALLNRFG